MKHFNDLEKLINILKKKNMKVCIAESLTGGKVAYSFVKIKGASEIFDFSIVCYSNNSKSYFFNADKIIKKYGVVSYETARVMLDKIQKFSDSQKRLRLSCTGYASQSLSNENIDIGTVYIGVGVGTKNKIVKKKFKNRGRVSIINSTVKALIYESIQILSR
tara:strand:+ start:255 stop:740 length:486 start_codon:yes stop_codon:yes gene_type:complete